MARDPPPAYTHKDYFKILTLFTCVARNLRQALFKGTQPIEIFFGEKKPVTSYVFIKSSVRMMSLNDKCTYLLYVYTQHNSKLCRAAILEVTGI